MNKGSQLRAIIYVPLILYGLFWIGYFVLSFNDPYYSLGIKYLVFGILYTLAGYLALLPVVGKSAIPKNWSDRKIVAICVFLCALVFILLPMKFLIPINFFNSPWEDGLPLSLMAISFITAMNMQHEQRVGASKIYTLLALSIAAIVIMLVVTIILALGGLA